MFASITTPATLQVAKAGLKIGGTLAAGTVAWAIQAYGNYKIAQAIDRRLKGGRRADRIRARLAKIEAEAELELEAEVRERLRPLAPHLDNLDAAVANAMNDIKAGRAATLYVAPAPPTSQPVVEPELV